MWLKVQLLNISNNSTSALWSARPWINHRRTPEWVARHTKPFKTVVDSSVCTCQLVHTHGQVCNSVRCACPQNVTFAKVDKEERLGSTKMKMEKKKKTWQILTISCCPRIFSKCEAMSRDPWWSLTIRYGCDSSGCYQCHVGPARYSLTGPWTTVPKCSRQTCHSDCLSVIVWPGTCGCFFETWQLGHHVGHLFRQHSGPHRHQPCTLFSDTLSGLSVTSRSSGQSLRSLSHKCFHLMSPLVSKSLLLV